MFVANHYLHDENTDKGKKTALFSTAVERSGKYDIHLYDTGNSNRATNVPAKVKHGGGTTTVTVNQREAPSEGYAKLGTFQLTADLPSSVTISTEGTDGYVIVDAVQWVENSE